MISRTVLLASVAACLAMTACGDAPAPPEASRAEAAAPAPDAPEAAAPPSFDIAEIPVSDAPLGDFPYFSVPEGYYTNEQFSSTIEAGRFPMWVGDMFIAVEGRIHQANIRVDDGKSFSTLEVEEKVRDAIAGAGGVELSNMVIPKSHTQDVLTRAFTQEFSNGLCWPSEPVRTYVVHRTDKDIWVHACTYGGIGAAWVIVETATSVAMPEPVDAATLGAQLDDGEARLPIAFPSASTALPDNAQSQVAALASALEARPALRLEILGYAGAMGDAAADALSKDRARAVIDALESLGIAGERLRGADAPEPEASQEEGAAPAPETARVILVRSP
ncbi:OmpA family protein [Marilutibacter aestuarii]|nr:OmpA family protein [Lysobacter aestuarii]